MSTYQKKLLNLTSTQKDKQAGPQNEAKIKNVSRRMFTAPPQTAFVLDPDTKFF